jgi:hypothetical protein
MGHTVAKKAKKAKEVLSVGLGALAFAKERRKSLRRRLAKEAKKAKKVPAPLSSFFRNRSGQRGHTLSSFFRNRGTGGVVCA